MYLTNIYPRNHAFPVLLIVATRQASRNLYVNTLTNNTWRPLTTLFSTYLLHSNIFLVTCFFSVTAAATF
jgi:hypothetical protein